MELFCSPSQRARRQCTCVGEAAKAASGLTAICQLIAALDPGVSSSAVMASLISWKATLIALLASLVSAGVLTQLIRLLRRNQRERIIATSNMTARLVDSLSQHEDAQGHGCRAAHDKAHCQRHRRDQKKHQYRHRAQRGDQLRCRS